MERSSQCGSAPASLLINGHITHAKRLLKVAESPLVNTSSSSTDCGAKRRQVRMQRDIWKYHCVRPKSENINFNPWCLKSWLTGLKFPYIYADLTYISCHNQIIMHDLSMCSHIQAAELSEWVRASCGRDGSSAAHTCAELRAFRLFPGLAPDLPPTMGSWPRRLTPARTPALPDTNLKMHGRTLCTKALFWCDLRTL